MKNKYYVYEHSRADNGKVFYVGVGTFNEAATSFVNQYKRAFAKTGRNKLWKQLTNEIGYKVSIVFTTDRREEANLKEKELIQLYGRKIYKHGYLCNFHDGGEGTAPKPYRPNKREIFVYSKQGQFIGSFDSKRQAAIHLGIPSGSIRQDLRPAYDFLFFTTSQGETCQPFKRKSVYNAFKNYPSREFLEKAVLEKSLTTLSREIGCSDTCLRKHVLKLGITLPSRTLFKGRPKS